MKIAVITVPYIDNAVLFNLTKNTYKDILNGGKDHELLNIAVVNKANSKEFKDYLNTVNDIVVDNDENCLSAAWNKGIDIAISEGYEMFFIPNLDISFTKADFNALANLASSSPESLLWSITGVNSVLKFKYLQRSKGTEFITHNDQSFSCFMLSKECVDRIGYFQDLFKPCYFEDDDYLRRIHLNGYLPLKTREGYFYHFVQATMKNSIMVQETYNKDLLKNRQLYIQLHGGLPGYERNYFIPQQG